MDETTKTRIEAHINSLKNAKVQGAWVAAGTFEGKIWIEACIENGPRMAKEATRILNELIADICHEHNIKISYKVTTHTEDYGKLVTASTEFTL